MSRLVLPMMVSGQVLGLDQPTYDRNSVHWVEPVELISLELGRLHRNPTSPLGWVPDRTGLR